MKELLAMKETDIPFFNVDITNEILSRLSIKDLSTSVSPKDGIPSFLRMHSKQSGRERPSGLFFQKFMDKVDHSREEPRNCTAKYYESIKYISLCKEHWNDQGMDCIETNRVCRW
jgi:hypothetical protein